MVRIVSAGEGKIGSEKDLRGKKKENTLFDA